MTDEEKKAEAAKVEAEKKAAEAKVAEAGKKEDDEAEDDDETPSDPKAHIAKLNAENTKRRQNEKALKAENAKLREDQSRKDKALEILTGKKVGEVDPLEKAKADSDLRQARLLIRADLAVVARDAHDPSMLYKAFPEKFKDVKVDLENDSVDRDSLKEAVADIRKENPFLFMKKGETKPGTAPFENPDKGQGGGGGNHFAAWQQLKKAGDSKGAQEYYNKNKTLILAQMK